MPPGLFCAAKIADKSMSFDFWGWVLKEGEMKYRVLNTKSGKSVVFLRLIVPVIFQSVIFYD